jgi:hypothetical protein
MEGEGSPVIDIMGDASKEPLLEASMASSSSGASSLGATSDVAKAEADVSMDPRKVMRSYDFRGSSVTVSHMWQLESLGYFAEGSARELGEVVVPEPNPDEAVVFKDFFSAGLWMLPHPALTEILLKFWV